MSPPAHPCAAPTLHSAAPAPPAGIVLASSAALSNLAAHNEGNCTRIADAGGIALLVPRLASPDPRAAERAAAVLGNLAAANEPLRAKIHAAGAVAHLVSRKRAHCLI